MSKRVYFRTPGDRSVRVSTSTTTVVKPGTGVVKRIIIGTAFSGTITVNDALGPKLVLKAAHPEGVRKLNLLCSGKIEVVTAGTPGDITVAYE